MLITDIVSSAHEACLVAPQTYVHKAMNIGSLMKPCNVTDSNLKQ